MSAKEEAPIEERLDRRRRFRNRRIVEKNSFDQPGKTAVKADPSTQSLDRKSSQRIVPTTSKPDKVSSATTAQNSAKQPSISSAQQTQPIQPVLTDEKINSASKLPIVEISPASNDERPITAKEDPPVTLPPITSAEKSATITDDKRVASHESSTSFASSATLFEIPPSERSSANFSKEPTAPILPAITPVEKSVVTPKPVTPITSATAILPVIVPSEQSKPTPSENPTVVQEPIAPIVSPVTLPAITPPEKPTRSVSEKPRITSEFRAQPVTLEESPSIPQEVRGYSTPNHGNKPESHPSALSHNPLFQTKPLTRSTSEQVVRKTKFKHQPIDSAIVKQNSLALPYLLSKRIVKAQIPHAGSLDSQQPDRKTVWE